MAGYVRQGSWNDGDPVDASDGNDEFNALATAFGNTTGHAHDGTADNGPVINVIGDAAIATPLNKILVDTANDNLGFWIDVSSSSVEQITISDGVMAAVTDSDVALGTTGIRWSKVWTDDITSGTLTATSGSITDSSGAISFGNENLTTTGTLGAGATTVTTLNASGVVKITTNNTFLQGVTTGAAARSLIGVNSSDLVSIDPDLLGTVFGSDVTLSAGHLILPYGEINDAGTDMNLVATSALTLATSAGTALVFASGSLDATFEGKVIGDSSSAGDYVRMYGGAGTAQWDIYGSGENLRISENSGGGGSIQMDSALNLNGVGLTANPGSEIFTVTSDGGGMYFGGTTASVDTRIVSQGTTCITMNGANATFLGDLSIATGLLVIGATGTPASASATGTTGTVLWDTNYIYICTATNTWKRVAIATW